MQAARNTADSLAHARLAAADVASSRSAQEAGAKVWNLWSSAEKAPVVTAIARFLVRGGRGMSSLL